jgi:hypothetical protein
MNRLRRWSVVCFVLLLAGLTRADDAPPAAKSGADKWLLDRSLTVTARGEPEPALKYRLLPLTSELKEGNAVPIYLRLIFEQSDQARKSWTETPEKWNELPLDKVPLPEARKFLEGVNQRFLQQFDYGARRKSAEWSYTLDQPDPIGMLLPDIAQMRGYAHMMVLRARVQVADGDFAGAARSFETGFAFSRHVAESPFLISSLVGVAIASRFADRVPEWIERPDAPNLYWSLTALPRPLIDIRKGMELEYRVVEMQFPDLADLDRPRSPGEWEAALKRVRTEMKRIDNLMSTGNDGQKPPALKPPLVDPDEPAEKSRDLVAARMFVATRTGKSPAEVAAMAPSRVLLLHFAGTFADLRDDVFRLTYLPFPQAWALEPDSAREVREASGQGGRLARMFLPSIQKAMERQVTLDRRIAMLRTIEALRLHAAVYGGQLPESLDQVKEVPVPLDPGTGKPFEYRRDGAMATLSSRLPGEPLEVTGLRYRLTMRVK